MPTLAVAFATVFPEVARAQNEEEPFCGYSRRHLDEDPVRRMCLRQCNLEDSGMFRPTFIEWEEYCRETAAMENWDTECESYMCCTFGCDVYGGDRDVCRNAQGEDRFNLLLDTKELLYSADMTQERRCDLDKCHSYCARSAFETCRELQWTQKCEAGQPELYGCDVRCNVSSKVQWSVTLLIMPIMSALSQMTA